MSLQRIKELHQEISQKQKRKKDLGQTIKDAFGNYKEFKDIEEQMKGLRERRKQIEALVRQQYSSEFNDLDELSSDIKDTKMVLSDLIWNEVMKNNTVEIVDEWDNHYVPQIVASLKKDK